MSTPGVEDSFRVRYHVRMGEYVTTAKAAEIIGCVDTWVRQLLRKGVLEGEMFGRDWRVLRKSAEAYAASERKPGRKPDGKSTKKKGKG